MLKLLCCGDWEQPEDQHSHTNIAACGFRVHPRADVHQCKNVKTGKGMPTIQGEGFLPSMGTFLKHGTQFLAST